MKQHSIPIFLNELIDVLLDNLLFYMPSELIFDGVIEQIEDLPVHFFDEIWLIDLHHGMYMVSNEDVAELSQRLFDKRSLLEEITFALLEKNKEVTPLEFQIIIEKYYDQLLFYLYITDWLITHINKYHHKDVHAGIIGVFKLQHDYLSVHLKNILSYFRPLIDLEKQHNFSAEKIALEHFPDLISRYRQSAIKNFLKKEEEISTEKEVKEGTKKALDTQKKAHPKKKQRPDISNTEIEEMVLEGVFKIKTRHSTH